VPVRSVLVPGVRLRPRIRLAFKRCCHHCDRRAQRRSPRQSNTNSAYSRGGKGATSRGTPAEIRDHCERLAIDSAPLVYASRMAAKVDSAAVQDGYQLSHHAFFFSAAGHWCRRNRLRGPSGQCWLVASLRDATQQRMSDQTRPARRYHWLSQTVTSFVRGGPRPRSPPGAGQSRRSRRDRTKPSVPKRQRRR